MNRWKRLLYYLIINVLVSSCTILTILTIWERTNRPLIETVEPALQSNASTATHRVVATPTVAPTASSTPAAELELFYEVQSGDTLGAIAATYGVAVEEIVEINELVSPDTLVVGDVLLIPVASEATPTDATSAIDSPGTRAPPPTIPAGTPNTPLPPEQIPQLEIPVVVGAGNLEDERVVIKLEGEGELYLENWQLEDEDGSVYVFPQLTLFKGGAVSVFTKAGVDSVVKLHWGLGETVWDVGEIVSLIDPQGEVQTTYRVP